MTVLYGTTVPSDSDGADGDLYVRTSNGALYLKASGTWGSAFFTPVNVANGKAWSDASIADATVVNPADYFMTVQGGVNKRATKGVVLGYKSYIFAISQTGTADPTVIEYKNDFIGTTFAWTRSSDGTYIVTASSNVFKANKCPNIGGTIYTSSAGPAGNNLWSLGSTLLEFTTDSATRTLLTYDVVTTGVLADDLIFHQLIELRVYD